MKVDAGPIAVGGPPRAGRSSHTWVGSNLFLLDAVADRATSAEVIAAVDAGRVAARAALREAASLELQGSPPRARRGERVTFTVRVTNLTGHKLPTGYPEQQVYLALDAGAIGVHRGRFDVAQRDVIDPVVSYRVVQGQHDVGPSGRLALADTVFSDNRIPPLGMTVTPTIAPVGHTFEEVAPGVLAHWDDVEVSLEIPCAVTVSSFEVSLVLRHLSLPGHYIDFLDAELPPPSVRGGALREAWRRTPAAPEEMASLRFTVRVDEAPCASADAGHITDDAATAVDAVEAVDAASSPDAAPIDARPSPADAALSDAGEPSVEGCSCAAPRATGGLPWLLAAVLIAARRRARS
jgi:hypothetical protein